MKNHHLSQHHRKYRHVDHHYIVQRYVVVQNTHYLLANRIKVIRNLNLCPKAVSRIGNLIIEEVANLDYSHYVVPSQAFTISLV